MTKVVGETVATPSFSLVVESKFFPEAQKLLARRFRIPRRIEPEGEYVRFEVVEEMVSQAPMRDQSMTLSN